MHNVRTNSQPLLSEGLRSFYTHIHLCISVFIFAIECLLFKVHTAVSQTEFSQKSNVKRENVIYAPCSLSVVLRVLTDAELITFCNCSDRAIDSIIYKARSMLTRLFHTYHRNPDNEKSVIILIAGLWNYFHQISKVLSMKMMLNAISFK